LRRCFAERDGCLRKESAILAGSCATDWQPRTDEGFFTGISSRRTF
jgi:hypothetical protein